MPVEPSASVSYSMYADNDDPNWEHLFLFLNALPIVTFSCDPEEHFRILSISANSRKLTGYDQSVFLNNPWFWLEHIHPEDKPAIDRLLHAVDCTSYQEYEFRWLTAAGIYRWFRGSWRGVELSPQDKCRIVGTWQDITDRKLLEQEFARYDQLNLIGHIAASMGHEIRNPMTTVRGFLQVLQDREEYQVHRDFFELMISELDKANALISDFLKLSHNRLLTLHPQSLAQVISDLLPLIQAEAAIHEKKLKISLEPVPDALLDSNEIQHMVLNLLRNGLEAMSKGKTLLLRTYSKGDYAVLAVTDQGTGIPNEVMASLGTPFLSTKEDRAGLGLAVCYSIAKRHGAFITVDTSSTGTHIEVHFPAFGQR